MNHIVLDDCLWVIVYGAVKYDITRFHLMKL